jgi:flagellar basal body-associated protein FliL
MRRRLILALVAFAVAAPAFAAEHGKKDAEEDKGAGLYVDIAQVGLPVIIKGRLVNYVFVAVRLNLASNANVSALRAKEPYFRDALVKAAHRTPFVVAKNPNVLDEAALKRVMLAEANRIAGGRGVTGVLVTTQAPQKHVSAPAG